MTTASSEQSTCRTTRSPTGAHPRARRPRLWRAVLTRVLCLWLSHHRPDEKARIIAHGGRVFEWGVPRVWLRDVDMPVSRSTPGTAPLPCLVPPMRHTLELLVQQGLAMARSFGDMAAETVGVFAEPELSKVTLTSNHRFVIWASDGVWEFISSQEACTIVYKHWNQGPRKAADALVSESVKRWNLEEDVVRCGARRIEHRRRAC